jgi:hypothetical protein
MWFTPKNDIGSQIKTPNLYQDLRKKKLASLLKYVIPTKLCHIFDEKIVKVLYISVSLTLVNFLNITR